MPERLAFAALNSPFKQNIHGKIKILKPEIKKSSSKSLKSCKCLKNMRPVLNKEKRFSSLYYAFIGNYSILDYFNIIYFIHSGIKL